MNLPDENILLIFMNIPERWKYEFQLKQINKQWNKVINEYNEKFTSWINPNNTRQLDI